jgi:hypothetical protein
MYVLLWWLVKIENASALGDRSLCGRCLIRVTSIYGMMSIRLFERMT